MVPLHGGMGIPTTNANPVAGTVYLMLFENPTDCTVNEVTFSNGTPIAGNCIVGIYGPITTEEVAAGTPVVVQSASTALTSTSAPQSVAIPSTRLLSGRYYVAVEFDNVSHTFLRQTNTKMYSGWTYTYARSGGYGALTDPCPATTDTAANFPSVRIKVSGN